MANIIKVICAFPAVLLAELVALPKRLFDDEEEVLKNDHEEDIL